MGGNGGGGQTSHAGDQGLGVAYQMTRRSSAYDVYSTTGSSGGSSGSSGGGLNSMAIAAAHQQMQCNRDADLMYNKRGSISTQGNYLINLFNDVQKVSRGIRIFYSKIIFFFFTFLFLPITISRFANKRCGNCDN